MREFTVGCKAVVTAAIHGNLAPPLPVGTEVEVTKVFDGNDCQVLTVLPHNADPVFNIWCGCATSPLKRLPV